MSENNPNIGLIESFIKNAKPEDLVELEWLQDHPEYNERPADIETFITSPLYLNMQKHIRPNILKELKNIFPDIPLDGKVSPFEEMVFMCGIGYGKTFMSSVILAYLIHCTLCLKDPQDFYGLAPKTPIHLMLMSNSERQARDVIFTNIKALIDGSPWFRTNNYGYNDKIQTQLNFPKEVFLIPGNSQETFFEGYNILAGIIDEADAHKKTSEKDYVEEGYNAMKRRIVSRYQDKGFLIMIGSPKTIDGFLMSRYKEGQEKDFIYSKSVPTWDSLEGTGKLSGETFRLEHPMLREDVTGKTKDGYMDIPIEYKGEFDRNIEKALRDLAAIPFYAVSPFFTLPDKVKNYTSDLNVPYDEYNIIDEDFKPDGTDYYWVHVDLAAKHDAVGIALGHITNFKEIEGDVKPVIELPMIMRIQAPPGGEIVFGDIRKILYNLVERGFNIKKITFDGWQSVEMIQHLRKAGLTAEVISVDKTMSPYESLKDSLYENRFISHPMDKFVEECVKLELIDGKKIDHPPKGSKDVSDAVAGCVYNIVTSSEARMGGGLAMPMLMGERIF